MNGQSQPVLWFNTGALHGDIQWFESWLTRTPPAEGSHVGPAWRLNTKVRRPVDGGTLSTQHICLPGGKKSWFALDEMFCFINEVLPPGVRGQVSKGLAVVCWDLRLLLARNRSQSTGPVSSLPEQPPKMFSAKLSTGCRFQMQLGQGALCLALWKMMKAKSKRMRDVSQRGGYNHLPWTGYSGVLGEYWNLQEI